MTCNPPNYFSSYTGKMEKIALPYTSLDIAQNILSDRLWTHLL